MNNNVLEYSSDELLGLAIIMSTPVIIVEGCDDVPVYERLSSLTENDCIVFASENLLCEGQGCEGVIKNIGIIRSTANGVPVEKYILGVIDRDARYYRDTLPADPALFTLHYYSIESHFVSQQSIKYLIPKMTRATHKLIQEKLYQEIYDEICSRLMFLYLVSLEALKKACVAGYSAEFGYKDTIKSILGRNLHLRLEDKRTELLAYGSSLGLSCNWQDLLKVCKGKWVLELFTDEIYTSIQLLPVRCKSADIAQCQFCAKGESSKCLYRNPSFFSAEIMRSQLFHNVECSELLYVRERIGQLLH